MIRRKVRCRGGQEGKWLVKKKKKLKQQVKYLGFKSSGVKGGVRGEQLGRIELFIVFRLFIYNLYFITNIEKG